jgi:hypothetical protein
VRAVHVTPSADDANEFDDPPIAIASVPFEATSLHCCEVGSVRAVHAEPSGDE